VVLVLGLVGGSRLGIAGASSGARKEVAEHQMIGELGRGDRREQLYICKTYCRFW